MDARLPRSRLLAIVFTSFLTWPVSAGSLYKFIDSNGAIAFTDVPPPSDARPVEVDEAMARANARIDVAEHNLAVARQGLWSPHDGLSLDTERMTPGDRARVEFYMKGVQLARQQLMDLLRERHASPWMQE